MASLERELKRILKDAGCYFVRAGEGSHEIWYGPITDRHFTVPQGIEMRHTANGILKQAGLEKRFRPATLPNRDSAFGLRPAQRKFDSDPFHYRYEFDADLYSLLFPALASATFGRFARK